MYRGEFLAYDIKRAVCSAFRRQPRECRSISSKSPEEENEENDRKARLVAASEVLIVAIGVILLNILVVFAYRYYQKEHRQKLMKNVVNLEVSKYFKIAQHEAGVNGSRELD